MKKDQQDFTLLVFLLGYVFSFYLMFFSKFRLKYRYDQHMMLKTSGTKQFLRNACIFLVDSWTLK